MIDIQQLLENTDLITLIEKDCGIGRRRGRWVMFHCPFPEHGNGDRDPSLGVTPENGRWHCFGCNRSGDAISWIMETRNLSFHQAIEMIKANNHSVLTSLENKPLRRNADQPAQSISQSWIDKGNDFIKECEENLWSELGTKALKYLYARDLTERMIRWYRLGYSPTDHRESANLWGFSAEDKPVYIPRGITIPSMARGQLWGVNIRRPAETPRYVKIRGSKAALFGADNLRGADIGLIVEGEFDCIIADREVGDAIGVVSLGSATQRLDLVVWGPYIMNLSQIFVIFDKDSAGNRGAQQLVRLGSKLINIQLPPGAWKDVNEFILAGGDLWQLLKASIDLSRLSAWVR